MPRSILDIGNTYNPEGQTLSERAPHLYSSFKQHYRRMRKRGAMWVPAEGGGWASDSSEDAFREFLQDFSDDERKDLKASVDEASKQKPKPNITQKIAALLEGMDNEAVKQLLEDMS